MLAKKIRPDNTYTLYIGGIYELDLNASPRLGLSGVVTKKTSYYPGGAIRVDIVSGANTLYYLLKDHLGSASVVLDSSGALIANGEQRYYPYGEKRITTAALPTDRLYTGQLELASLGGIYNYGARFYSPRLGRFLSADTIVPNWRNPQSLNRFSYVYNNPLRYNDPTGHCTSDPDDPCNSRPRPGPTQPPPPHSPPPCNSFYCAPWPPSNGGGNGGGGSGGNGGGGNSGSGGNGGNGNGGGGSNGGGNGGSGNDGGNGDGGNGGITQPIKTTNLTQCQIYPSICNGNGNRPHGSASMIPTGSIPGIACSLLDCVLSFVSVIASAFTLAGDARIAGTAFVVDVVVTGWAILRTQDDYNNGRISLTRALVLDGTAVAGVVPGGFGITFSILNFGATVTGQPP